MKISVCIAAYNGEKYIERQLISILLQVSMDDEVIIVDDLSTDKTLEIIANIGDRRIKIINNDFNIGVVETFEKAITNASGDIIFLSDQDDIWMPNKIETFLMIFNSQPKTTLVLSDAEMIDSEGKITTDSYFKLRGKFTDRLVNNIIKNKYHGCTMAFRRDILAVALPFPENIPMHDMWIGIVNSIYGNTFYIDKALIQHRRHSSNTGLGFNSSASLYSKLTWRLILVKNILELVFRTFLNKCRNLHY